MTPAMLSMDSVVVPVRVPACGRCSSSCANGNIDVADTSKDGRYSFSTVYNLDQGKDMGSMMQDDRDAVAAIDIPAAAKAVAVGRGGSRH